MPFVDMHDYNPRARRFWLLVVSLGSCVIAVTAWDLARLEWGLLVQVLGAAGIAAVVALFPVRVPGTKISIGGGEIFIFLTVLIYGVAAGVIRSGSFSTTSSRRPRRPAVLPKTC